MQSNNCDNPQHSLATAYNLSLWLLCTNNMLAGVCKFDTLKAPSIQCLWLCCAVLWFGVLCCVVVCVVVFVVAVYQQYVGRSVQI